MAGMKVAHICYDDYANFAYGQHKALLSVGVESRCVKLKPHTFDYHEQAEVVTLPEMIRAAKGADVIIVYHSHGHIINSISNFVQRKGTGHRKIVSFHTGSIFRSDPAGTMKIHDDCGTHSHLTDQCEFLLLPEGKRLKYHAAAIDTEYISQFRVQRNNDKPVFGHFPSNPDVKGSADIVRMMQEIGVPLRYDYTKVSHAEQLRRMAECDVYIELFKPELNGKPYGCFGVTAFEAAALGCNVITQCVNIDAYVGEYNCYPAFVMPSDLKGFADAISERSGLQNFGLTEGVHYQQEAAKVWIDEYHSLHATGHRLKTILQGI